MRSDEVKRTPFSQNEEPIDVDDADEEKIVFPVRYTCVHINDPVHCDLWDQHLEDPCYYPTVNEDTRCRYCHHRNTLRRVK